MALGLSLSLAAPLRASAVEYGTATKVDFNLSKENGRSRFLNRNSEAWYARYLAIKRAKTTIDAQYYIIEDDIFGRSFLGLLLEKQKMGVKVRLMMDARGTHMFTRTALGQDYLQELVAYGAEVRVYNPYVANGGPRLKIMASDHDKLLIVDGMILITGGRNISGHYFLDREDLPTSYEDADILVESKNVAGQAKKAFDYEFESRFTYHIKKDRLGNWRPRDNALARAEHAMTLKLYGDELLPTYVKEFPELAGFKSLSSVAKFRMFDATSADSAMLMLDNSSSLHEDDHRKLSQITDGLIKSIQSARSEILIQNPYVVLTDRIKNALIHAGRRGVKILFLTNSPTSTDSLLTQAIFNHEWKEILEQIPNSEIFATKGPGKLHAKVFAFDNEYAIVGSYNMDVISEQINSEGAVFVRSAHINQKIRESIRRVIIESSVRYSLQEGQGPEQIQDSDWAILKLDFIYNIAKYMRDYI